MFVNLYLTPIIFIIACVMLIRQCFKPYFLDPSKIRISANRNYIEKNQRKINLMGKLFTGIVCVISIVFFIFPAIADTVSYLKNDFVYAVVEMPEDYNAYDTDSKHARITAYLHHELSYDPEENRLHFDEKNNGDYDTITLRIPIVDYKKCDLFLVGYLPNTTCGEVIYSIPYNEITSNYPQFELIGGQEFD